MEANPVRIIEYFNGEKQSVIPLFQRRYSWSKKNWQILWDDLLTQYDAGLDSKHFLGAIVSISARSVPAGVSKHLVIDGQQRLTTISLLLRALKDVVDERNAARIEDYLINRHQEDPDRLKLLPTQADRAIYRRLITHDTAQSNDSALLSGYRFFINKLKGKDLDDNQIDAGRMLQTLTACLQVVMINLGDADDPYLIFESLNYKGEPLTQSDLVRNYVLMRFRHSLELGGEQEEVYETYWKPMEDELADTLTEFLRHYCMKDGENVKRAGVYSAVKSYFTPIPDSDTDAVKTRLADMRRYGVFYRCFTAPDNEPRERIRLRLEELHGLDFRSSYPFLLRLFDGLDNGSVTEEDALDVLTLLESFVVRRLVCSVPTNALNKLFLGWSKAFPSENVPTWFRMSLAHGLRGSRWPTDQEFSDALVNRPQYGRKATRHILTSIERDHGHKEIVDLSTATIEHVMPQTMTPEWEAFLGPGADEIHERWLNTIGNLSLTAYNSELGNLPFEEKKKRFLESNIELNKTICQSSEWDGNAIDLRGQSLSETALRLWPGPLSKATIECSDDDSEEGESKTKPASFHKACVDKIARKLGVSFQQRGRIQFVDSGGTTRLTIAVSKKHENGQGEAFWFAFHPQQQDWLSAQGTAYAGYGCGSEDTVFLFPLRKMNEWQERFFTTVQKERMYWHIQIVLRDGGSYLSVKKEFDPIPINEYRL